jgi:hypothetical protein
MSEIAPETQVAAGAGPDASRAAHERVVTEARELAPTRGLGDLLAAVNAYGAVCVQPYRQFLITQADRLEAQAPGFEVWRVAGADGAYCIEFDRSNVANPQREAEQWIADHKAYCEHKGFTAQRAHVYSSAERAMRETAQIIREALQRLGEPHGSC